MQQVQPGWSLPPTVHIQNKMWCVFKTTQHLGMMVKEKQEVVKKCTNCMGNHPAWSKICPQRLNRIFEQRKTNPQAATTPPAPWSTSNSTTHEMTPGLHRTLGDSKQTFTMIPASTETSTMATVLSELFSDRAATHNVPQQTQLTHQHLHNARLNIVNAACATPDDTDA